MARNSIIDKPATVKQLINSEVFVVINYTTGEIKVFATKDKAYAYSFDNDFESGGVAIQKCIVE